MNVVPRDASDEQVLDIVRGWIDVLAQKDYSAVFEAIGLSIRGEAPGAECIEGCIQYYRSPEYYPGMEEFSVTDWRTAHGGNPEPEQSVVWYQPNSIKMAGAVSFDLPLNGCWSDLTADFVFFENNDPAGYNLCLEEIDSRVQHYRIMAARERELSDSDELMEEHFDEPMTVSQSSPSYHAGRCDLSGVELSEKQDEDVVT